jgi:enolase
MSSRIQSIRSRRIWDSRGRPTVEVEVALADGAIGRGMAPAGASRGSREAVDLRDGGDWLDGYDVRNALRGITEVIAPALVGMDAADQEGVDTRLIGLDPTATKEVLGGNACVATSMAVLDAAARSAGQPLWKYLAGYRKVRLPLPEVQIFGGGAHAGRRIDIQDLLIMPMGADTFAQGMEMVAAVYHAAGRVMEERGKRAGVADEGGWWPDFDTNEQALETLLLSIERSGLKPGEDIAISLDLAASEFHRDGHYVLGLEQRRLDRAEWIDVLMGWLARYPIVSIEDPLGESDAEGMAMITAAVGGTVQVIGDDFLTTRVDRIGEAAGQGACNAVLLKPNQVGTITETRRALEAARALDWGCIVSARSGETEDVMITHLSTGWDAGQLKVGSFARSERLAKWNEAIRIEDDPSSAIAFAGADALRVDWRNGPWAR